MGLWYQSVMILKIEKLSFIHLQLILGRYIYYLHSLGKYKNIILFTWYLKVKIIKKLQYLNAAYYNLLVFSVILEIFKFNKSWEYRAKP